MENKFDPKKNYTWSEDSLWSLTGLEIGALKALIDLTLNSEEARRVFLAVDCAAILRKQLENGIKNGTLKEMETPIVEAAQTATGQPKTEIDEN